MTPFETAVLDALEELVARTEELSANQADIGLWIVLSAVSVTILCGMKFIELVLRGKNEKDFY